MLTSCNLVKLMWTLLESHHSRNSRDSRPMTSGCRWIAWVLVESRDLWNPTPAMSS